jgi:phosphopantothenoylcysteine decarboxylase/phosphopantothenate--cysteine ligase
MTAKRVVLGVGGGIAAYKAAELTRLLVKQGFAVQPVMTEAAQQFITPLTLASLANRKVITNLFAPQQNSDAVLSSAIEHINVAIEHDLLLVAPATANILAQFAQGAAPDFLSTLYLAFTGPVLLAPAMNTNMWQNPAVQRNVERLRADGVRMIGPDAGDLACGMVGAGRMAEPEEIAAAVALLLKTKNDFAGCKLLITAGPTEEPLDPVRVLTNRSSGKMGFALAAAAAERGASVTLVAGPVSLATPPGVERVNVRTAAEMHEKVLSLWPRMDVFIGVAAVADFRPVTVASGKIKKAGANLTLELTPNPDILAAVGSSKGSRRVVGFAAETNNPGAEAFDQEALRKLQAKHCDLLVANAVDAHATVFGADENTVKIFRQGRPPVSAGPAKKIEIAHAILDELAALDLRS